VQRVSPAAAAGAQDWHFPFNIGIAAGEQRLSFDVFFE
jgi:hypothetical protein